MSEKIRRINKEPLLKRIQAPQKSGTFFLISTAILLTSIGTYLAFRSAGNFFNPMAASVAGPKTSAGGAADRELAAAICRSENCFWVNRGGVAFGQSGRVGGNITLGFDDKTGRTLEVGRQLLKPESLAELLFLRKRFSDESNVLLKEGETVDSDLKDFNFKTNEGWTLKFTLVENAYKTIEVFKKTLEEVKKTAPTSALDYVDLRIPNKVFYKFR